MKFNIIYPIYGSSWGQDDITEVEKELDTDAITFDSESVSNDTGFQTRNNNYMKYRGIRPNSIRINLTKEIITGNKDGMYQLLFDITSYYDSVSESFMNRCNVYQRVFIDKNNFIDMINSDGRIDNMLHAIINQFITKKRLYLCLFVRDPRHNLGAGNEYVEVREDTPSDIVINLFKRYGFID